MKQILFLFSFFLVCNLSAQEVISETSEYIPYQDTLFVFQQTTITNKGLDGINDTVVTYSSPALDTVGLIDAIRVASLNKTNQQVAKMRNAFEFKKVFSSLRDSDGLVEELGSDLDSLNVAQYGQYFKGRYRMVTDSTNFTLNIVDHPFFPRFLRATGEDDEGNFNVRVYSRYMMSIVIDGKQEYVIWDGDSRDRPVFRSPTFAIPAAINDINMIRLFKLD